MARLRRTSSRAGKRPAKLLRRYFEDWLNLPFDLNPYQRAGDPLSRAKVELRAYWNRLGEHIEWASAVEMATGTKPSYGLCLLSWRGVPPAGDPADDDFLAVMLVRSEPSPEPSPRPAAVVIPLRR